MKELAALAGGWEPADSVASYHKYRYYRDEVNNMEPDEIFKQYERREWASNIIGTDSFVVIKGGLTYEGVRSLLAMLALYDDIIIYENENE